MKRLIYLAFTFALNIAMCGAQTFYTYNVSEALPCTQNCAGNINLSGTITTDNLGTLTASDIVVWDLSIWPDNQAKIRLTQTIGGFGTSGSPDIFATDEDLTITLNTTKDGFQFAGNSSSPASWLYAFTSVPLETLFYNSNNGQQDVASQLLTVPSTFTASAVSITETPEPGSFFMMLVAGLLALATFGIVERANRKRT